MSKRRNVSINTGVSSPVVKEVTPLIKPNKVSLDNLNRHLTPEIKYALNECMSKFPDKSERIVAHANISDEALLGYVKTLTITSIEQPVTEETEE